MLFYHWRTNNWNQVEETDSAIGAENHDIYIHIDKKSKDFNKKEFLSITRKSKLYIFQEYEVFWGGFSQVHVETYLFEKAHALKYDYYHLISGADLPLKSNKEIDAFFEQHKGTEFILYDEDKLKNDPEITRRAKILSFSSKL